MSFRRIVAGVDFSEASLGAARWVARHLAPEGELVLVHVVNEPRLPRFLQAHAGSPLERTRDAAPSLHGALRGLANMLGAHRTRVELLAGAPADALALVAAELDADLICVGRGSGRRGSARFGATTSQRLLARTRLPVLVVSAAPATAPARILVGVDDRPGTDVVLRVASSVAASHAARMDVVHVLEPEVVGFATGSRAPGPPGDTVLMRRAGLLRTLRSDALDTLKLGVLARDWLGDAVLRHLSPAAHVRPSVREGDPGQELVAHAHRGAVDLLVVGRGGDATHAGLPVGALRLGSTARFALWAAPCPVLVCALDQPAVLHNAPRRRGSREARRSTPLTIRGADDDTARTGRQRAPHPALEDDAGWVPDDAA